MNFTNFFHSGMVDSDYYGTSSSISSRCSSSGTPSCASSPCSSDRDYSIETSSLHESVFDLDYADLGAFFCHL